MTNYLIECSTNGGATFALIGTANGGMTGYDIPGAITGDASYNNVYEIMAGYPDGSVSFEAYAYLSASSSPPALTANLYITANLVRNETGRWQLMFSAIPSTVQSIKLDWYRYNNSYSASVSTEGNGYISVNIPTNSISNGVYVIPDWQATNIIGNDIDGSELLIRALGATNSVGPAALAGFFPYDAPCFVDGREHLKQNLLFELREATASRLKTPLSDNKVDLLPPYGNLAIPADTNYVESSFLHWCESEKTSGLLTYVKKDDLWPITANYELHGELYDPDYPGPSSFIWQTNLVSDPAPPVLGLPDPYWIDQGLTNLTDLGATTNDSDLDLASSDRNLFGLAFETSLVRFPLILETDDGTFVTNPPVTLGPGGSVSLDDVSVYYSQTADPSLQFSNYYFAIVNTPGTALPESTAPVQATPLPSWPRFQTTNQTGLQITSVGMPTTVGGWAKLAIQDGYSGKSAYLGQYFQTNAFVITNGAVTTNTTGVVSPYGDFFPMVPGQVAMVTMPDSLGDPVGTNAVDVISLNVDANHDGIMDFSYAGPDQTSSSRPFRFWVNDVNDTGDEGGDGIPGQGAQGDGLIYSEGADDQPFYSIQGSRNLLNFFPVYLNIGSLFESNAFSAGISVTDTNYQFVLSQADGALRFAYTDLLPTNYLDFLRSTNEVFDYLHDAPLITISNLNSGGVAVDGFFLSQIAVNNGGIILVEAWTNTTQPLVLTAYHGTNQIAQAQLYLSISGVEQMFRSKTMLLYPQPGTVPDRLTDASVPNEPDTTDVNFIFAHGYNVNPEQARGWHADMYKRFYWSGSHAKYYGVTWSASDSQVAGRVSINLQTNIVHAFTAAPLLNNFLNSLSGTNVVAGHSLGNMLLLSTLNDCSNQNIATYCMIDAAVAIEAIDAGASFNPDMYSSAWTNYESSLWASKWHNLFPTNDARGQLTWRGRLANMQNAEVYNFYSSGEEVLRDYPADPPNSYIGITASQLVSIWHGNTGENAWAFQEKLKGLMPGNGFLSSNHGGWQFNDPAYGTNYDIYNPAAFIHMSPSSAAALTTTQLKTNAFFNFCSATSITPAVTNDLGLESSSGSAYAQANQNRILSDTIPCLTLPLGANPVTDLGIVAQSVDMQASYENGWPAGRVARTVGATAAGEWHHSDVRAVAYTFTYKLFDEIVAVGNLK